MTKQDKTRQLSIEQANALEHLLQGQSDRAVAEAVGVSPADHLGVAQP